MEINVYVVFLEKNSLASFALVFTLPASPLGFAYFHTSLREPDTQILLIK